MEQKKLSYKERIDIEEADEMIKFEIESGNPFSEFSSYKSYKAVFRKPKLLNKKSEKADENQNDIKEDELPF